MKTRLVKNIFTLWGFTVIAGLTSALFYILMAKFLSVEDYGLFYSLISFIYLLTIPQETIRTLVSKLFAKFNIKKEKGKMKYVFLSYLKKMFFVGVISFAIFLILIPFMKTLFKTSSLPLILVGVTLIFAFILPVVWGVLQGTFRFKQLGINNVLEMVVKLSIALLLIFLLPGPLKVIGALIAIPASFLFSFLLGLIPIKDILKATKKKYKEKEAWKYALASLAIFTLIGVMCSLDVILARYFFHEKTSGLYAGLSMIATALFFVSMNAKRVMLPTIVKDGERKNPRRILAKTALIIGLLFGGFFIISFVYPQTIVEIFLGPKYFEAAHLLKYVVLAFAFFSLSVLLAFYNLSIDKNKKISLRILASGAFMQVALLLIFHATLLQFITMILIVNVLMFAAFLLVSLKKV